MDTLLQCETLFEHTDTSGDQKLDYEEFVAVLKQMDRNLKSLPATAQVASQQVSHSQSQWGRLTLSRVDVPSLSLTHTHRESTWVTS